MENIIGGYSIRRDQLRNTHYLEFAEKLIEELLDGYNVYFEVIDEGWREGWKTVIAQRVYDLVTPEEYIDTATRVRITVDHDIPSHPRITALPPEDHSLSSEEVNAAIKRLLKSAGFPSTEIAE